MNDITDDNPETCFNSTSFGNVTYRILLRYKQPLRIKHIALKFQNITGCSSFDGAPTVQVWKSMGACKNEQCASPFILSPVVDVHNNSCIYLWQEGAGFTDEIVFVVSNPLSLCHVSVS